MVNLTTPINTEGLPTKKEMERVEEIRGKRGTITVPTISDGGTSGVPSSEIRDVSIELGEEGDVKVVEGGTSEKGGPRYDPLAPPQRQPTTNQQITQGVVSEYNPPSFSERIKSIPSYIKTNIGIDPIGTIVGTGQRVIGDVSYKKQTKYEKAKEEIKKGYPLDQTTYPRKQDSKKYSLVTKEGLKEYELTRGEYTNEQLKWMAASGSSQEKKATMEEITKRISENASKQLKEEFERTEQPKINNLTAESQAKVNRIRDELVKRTDLTTEEKNKILDQYVEIENERLNENTQKIVNDFNETRGKEVQKKVEGELEKIQQNINIERNIRTGIKTAAIGAVIAPVAGAVIGESTAARGAAGFVGGLATTAVGTQISVGLIEDYKQGKLNALSIASRFSEAAPLIGFYAGAKASSKLFNSNLKSKEKGQIDTALKTSELKVTNQKVITKEADLKKLDLTNEGRLQIIGNYQQGYSMRKVDYEFYNKNSFLNNILKKAFPSRKISFIEVIDSKGNIINVISVGRIKLGGGKYIYKEDIIKGSTGIRDKSGNILMETTTYSKPSGKEVKVIRTSELIKPKVDYIKDVSTGKIIRRISSKSITIPKNAEYPISKSKTISYEELTKGEQNLIDLNIKDKYGTSKQLFAEQDLVFENLKSGGVSERIIKPIEFKSVKPVDFSKLYGEPGLTTQSIQKGIITPKTDFSKDVKNILSSASKNLKETTDITNLGAVSSLSPKEIETQGINYNKLTQEPSIIDLERIKEKEREKLKTSTTIKPTSATINANAIKEALSQSNTEIQKIGLKELQKQKLKMKIPQMTMTIPNIPPPTINFEIPTPPPPIGIGLKLPKKTTKKKKKGVKKKIGKEAKYTASLIAAAVQQKPIKVTGEQYKKLGKKTFLGTEIRPVLEIIPEKIKKVDFEIT